MKRGRPNVFIWKAGFADLERAAMLTMLVSEWHRRFSEVEKGFYEELAAHEAEPCLQCDLELCLVREGKETRRVMQNTEGLLADYSTRH